MAMTCDDGDACTTLDTVMPRACNLPGGRGSVTATTVTWLARTTVAMRRDDAVVNAPNDTNCDVGLF